MVKRIILIVAIAMIAFSGVALADDTATVTVSANVVGTCKFASGDTVVFGTLDPSVGTNVNGTIAQPTTFWCTKGTTYTITDDDGLSEDGTTHRVKHASLAEYIPYSFAYTGTGTGAGAGPTNRITMDIISAVQGTDYINASAGSYADTVILTITT